MQWHFSSGIALFPLPWVPETFLARFPVSVKSSPLAASAYGRRCVSLRPTAKIPAAREKNLWYPGYVSMGCVNQYNIKFKCKCLTSDG